MARIKSAWEIALEKTQDIQVDEAKYNADRLEKEGMALGGGYLNNLEYKLEDLGARYASYSEGDRTLVHKGIVSTILSNISLPQDDLYQLRFERTTDLVNIVSQGNANALGLMEQIGGFMKQYLDCKEEFVNRMKTQIQQAMEQDPQNMNGHQYSQMISQNLKKIDAQYGSALENTKETLRQILG